MIFYFSTGLRFSMISVECSVHICSCPCLIFGIYMKFLFISGFEARYLGVAMVNKMAAIQYCLEVTSKKMEYWLLFQNCQNFAKEILICLTGDKKILKKSPVDAGTSVGILAAIAGVVAVFAVGSKVLSSNQCEDQISDEDD